MSGEAEALQAKIDELESAIGSFQAKGQDPSAVVFAQDMFKARLAALRDDTPAEEAAYTRSVDGFKRLEMNQEAATIAVEATRAFAGKNPEAAWRFCQSAIEAADLLWWQTPMPDRLQVPRVAVEATDLGVKIAHARQDHRRIFDWIQMIKSRWLSDVLMMRHVSRHFDPLQVLGDLGGLEPARIKYQKIFHDAAAALDLGWNSYLAGQIGEQRLQQLERQVSQAYAALGAAIMGPARPIAGSCSVTDIQSRLKDHEALLEIFVQTDGIHLLLVTQDRFAPFHQPIKATELQQRVLLGVYLALIQNESRRDFSQQVDALDDPEKQDVLRQVGGILYQDPVEHLQALYDIMLKPLECDLRVVKRLIICPHWVLHGVPFHAMGPSVATSDLLIRSKVITYCPSATIWARLRDMEQDRTAASNKRDLILGVEAKTGSGWWLAVQDFISRLRGDSHLSDFEAEAAQIAVSVKAGPILGRDATKARVLAEFPSAGIVHLSCHSVLNRPDAVANGLLLADGILTVAEILTAERIGTAQPSLISLSACRSGLDRVEPGDTFRGIGYAFLARSGCPILASLWPVDAEATRCLMEVLYQEYEKCGDWANALGLAQLATMRSSSRVGTGGKSISFADPYFWSGFSVIGS